MTSNSTTTDKLLQGTKQLQESVDMFTRIIGALSHPEGRQRLPGAILLESRRAAGLTQGQLAEAVHRPIAYIIRLELSQEFLETTQEDIDMARSIADALCAATVIVDPLSLVLQKDIEYEY